jgi:carboxyl-terminal processing protease
LKGVASDITLPSFADAIDIGEEYYDYALKWEKIKAVKYQRFGLVDPYLKKLQARVTERVKKSEDFMKIQKDIDEYKKKEKEGDRVTLNLEEQKKERAEKGDEEAETEAHASIDEESAAALLEKDVHLQEALKIAVDYELLINKRPLGKMSIPAVEKQKELIAKAEKEKKKVSIKTADTKAGAKTPQASVENEKKKGETPKTKKP